ncbi:putative 4-alpha-glucanotransferase DPE1, chloroplastic/amyloplastic [Nannochloris sp. 'desiccata']|nr:hypothetical protein KSW81_000271 [Chlorella desiccata (nom. nud.)]KAH7620113.1 putative 4-alpha-glucanotransferase DPE1, chloroplastic/amyloplastic [Chlorella desiccata (nom. nud.)]
MKGMVCTPTTTTSNSSVLLHQGGTKCIALRRFVASSGNIPSIVASAGGTHCSNQLVLRKLQLNHARLSRSSGFSTTTAMASSSSSITPYPDPYPGVKPGQDLPPGYDHVGPSPPKHRRAGIVLHPTSLPGPYGSGEIGTEALRFVDWLVDSGIQIWQMLPLVPPETTYWSPYSGLDALCGNTLLIPLEGLVELGLLEASSLPPHQPSTQNADFPAVAEVKLPLLETAAARLLDGAEFSGLRNDLNTWRRTNATWVEESALFSAITEIPELDEVAWWDWPEKIRDRDASTLAELKIEHARRIDVFIALQFLFDRFWRAVRDYANARGVVLIGDMPIYVGGQSADVWANRKLFELTKDGSPALVSGVPPDAFSSTGQLWGSPLYDWQAHAAEKYSWWIRRFKRSLELYDETRVDHFRAFAGYWAVEAWRDTAMIGTWKRGPGADLFVALEKAFRSNPILAEDLGVITSDVIALRDAINAPGMLVLQFAWGGGATNTHLLHNARENSFVYPGTHDNQTTTGWWQHGATPEEKILIKKYLGMAESDEDISGAFMRAAFGSVAKTAVVTMQDVLRMDDTCRMNTPGKAEGNWSWRLEGNSANEVWDILRENADELREMVKITDRLSEAHKETEN